MTIFTDILVMGTNTGTVSVEPITMSGTLITHDPQIYNGLSTVTSGVSGEVYSLIKNDLTIASDPTNDWWIGLDRLVYAAFDGTNHPQHVARYAPTTRYGWTSGGASNNPQLWAAVLEHDDFTGEKSSLTNASITLELDLTSTNVDDASNRAMADGVIKPANGGTLGYYQASVGYGLSVAEGAYVKKMIGFGGSCTGAAIDPRYVAFTSPESTSLAVQNFATTTATVTNGTLVPVSNVLPFTTDRFNFDSNNGGGGAVVWIGGISAILTNTTP